MKVLIVSKTRLYNERCVGGLREDGQSVRLLTPQGNNQPLNTQFDVGDVWELDMTPRPNCVPPHVEDVLVTGQEYVDECENLTEELLQRVAPWEGGPDSLFDGHLRVTGNDHMYIRKPWVPDRSTWFWLPDRDLTLVKNGNKCYYAYPGGEEIKYVGLMQPIDSIPAKTLVRLSLARWWKQEGADDTLEERCYLQLSGWYS
tara:strand:+ start:1143 stop:1745 length:603 start_codon:yes stop_codon:yes gene_type:complete